MIEPRLSVRVAPEDFDTAALQRELLCGQFSEGGVATFTGYVRGGGEAGVHTLELEHYPAMTEKSILVILGDAARRWPISAASVVHRVGRLSAGDQIVWVGVAAAHRGEAFHACEYIMDYLKTRAPFWKKELGADGEVWVEARAEDEDKAAGWSER
jgi:molybdopterin synthase catalytic subunit